MRSILETQTENQDANSVKSTLSARLDSPISIDSRSLSELSLRERQELNYKSIFGGGLQSILTNFNNGKVRNPDRIYMQLLKINYQIAAWMLIDMANEYNCYIDVCSIMLYTWNPFRNKGISSGLFASQVPFLKALSKPIAAYVPQNDPERGFFKKLAKTYNLNIVIYNPTLYFIK